MPSSALAASHRDERAQSVIAQEKPSPDQHAEIDREQGTVSTGSPWALHTHRMKGNKIDILSNFYAIAFPYPFLCTIRD